MIAKMNINFDSQMQTCLAAIQSFVALLTKRRYLFRNRIHTGALVIIFVASCTVFWHVPTSILDVDTDPFRVYEDEAPVLNETGDIRFTNTPVGPMRPQHQFSAHGLGVIHAVFPEPPVLTVITITKNPRDVFLDTARFMAEQSLRPVSWLIVNDHTESRQSYTMLKKIAALDPRFLLTNSTKEPGFTNGRIFALSLLRKSRTPYFAFLDDDDYFELTAYEKCAWMLESISQASMCGSFVVGFGERNYTWSHGFHSGIKAFLKNPLTGSEVIRTSVLDNTDCTFDEKLTTGMEDWDFYLCLASHGKWGTTIPEYLFWYRQNPETLRQSRWGSLFEDEEKTSEFIRSRYEHLEKHFPQTEVPDTEEFESFNMTLPFRNELRLKKSILFIMPWMSVGGGDTANLRLVKEFSLRGYRITIVCTLLNLHMKSMVSRPLFMQYTHDVFLLPGMLRLADAPRFLAYLIESRGVQKVFLSNSQLGYGLLPWISNRYPDVTFVDYVHNQEPAWKSGGYAAFSTVHQHSLDATFTSSQGTRQYMISHGHDPSTVEVGYLGIDMSEVQPLKSEEKAALRRQLNIPQHATVVIYLARMIPHKQPRVALDAFIQVMKQMKSKEHSSMSTKYRLIMVGDGSVMREMRRIAAPHGDLIMMLGSLHHAEALRYLSVSDIFCLPSVAEGVSFALAESMAFGVTALTTTVGGFSEILEKNGSHGVMVKATGDREKDTKLFATQLGKLINEAIWRSEMGRKNMTRVRSFFDAENRIPGLVMRILGVRRRRKIVAGTHTDLSALHYTLIAVLKDVGVFSDYAQIQKTLQGKPRGDWGTKYRAICGEFSDTITSLIDILEKPKICIEGEKVDEDHMQKSALEQCGRWCIMDLTDEKKQRGWHVMESCGGVELFDDPVHKCTLWYRDHVKKRS